MANLDRSLSPQEFIDNVVKENRKGWGIVPFTGSGVSAHSGILTGMQFTDYLTWMVFRCVAEKGALDEADLKPSKRWSVRRNGWVRPPNLKESQFVAKWVFEHYSDLCESHGLHVWPASEKYFVDALTPSSKSREGSASKEPTHTLDAHLRRPLLPAVLRKWGTTHVDDNGIKDFFRLLHADDVVHDVLTQPNLSPDSQEAIIERAIRSLHDWRATLEFLARLGSRNSGATNDESNACMVERDSSVIDGFNLHITRGRKPNLAHTMICHLVNPLRSRVIFTTNFDTLQEEAFEQLGTHFEVIPVSVRGELPSPDTVHSLNCIIKLHGALTETRADFSLDDPPPLADKNRFFHSVAGCFPLDLANGQTVEGSRRFLPNHLLVCGYSGKDARCVHLIKYFLDHCTNAKLFWVCFSDDDFARVKEIFSEKSYSDRIFVTISDRLDLLLQELYQTLTLRLPRGGFSYQYSHDVPPELWTTSENERCCASAEKIQLALGTSTNPPTPPIKPVWVEVEPIQQDNNAPILSGLMVILHKTINQLTSKGYSVIWVEMEDFANPLELLHYVLQVISLRLGLFQLEHAMRVPTRMQLSSNLQYEWVKVIKQQINYFSIQSQRFVLFFYGRNIPGSCSGWEGESWTEAHYDEFHNMLKALVQNDFRVVYAPFTEKRKTYNQDKARHIVERSNKLRAMYSKEQTPQPDGLAEFHRNFIDELLLTKVKSDSLKNTSTPADNQKNEDYQVVYCSPEHNGVRSLLEVLDDIRKTLKDSFIPRSTESHEDHSLDTCEPSDSFNSSSTFKNDSDYSASVWFLYASSYYRNSRPLNVFLGSPVFPPGKRFNIEGFDQDWYRMMHAKGLLATYRSSTPLFWRKAGGNHWLYRDARLGLQFMLGNCLNSDRSGYLCQTNSWIHYWISQWYFRAFCTTDHAAPLCESLYHLYQCICAAPYAQRQSATSFSTENETKETSQQSYRKHLWLRAISDWIKILQIGRNSLLFWLDPLAAKAWFDTEVINKIIENVTLSFRYIFVNTAKTNILSEIPDAYLFVDKLQRRTRPVDEWLFSKLSSDTRDALLQHNNNKCEIISIQSLLLKDLNLLINGPLIHDEERFKGIEMSVTLTELRELNAKEGGLTHVNRLLLEDAYPHELKLTPHLFGTVSYANGLIFELRRELTSCWSEFTEDQFLPTLPLDGLRVSDSSPTTTISLRRIEEYHFGKAQLYHYDINKWRLDEKDVRSNNKIGNAKLSVIIDALKNDEIKYKNNACYDNDDNISNSTNTPNNDILYTTLREIVRNIIHNADAYEVLPQLISFLVKLAYEHIRRAEIIEYSESIETLIDCMHVVPCSPCSRVLWRQVNVLSRLASMVCQYTPPSLGQWELGQRVFVLGYLGLSLGHLGRFFEAHRRLNEASAMLSKLPRKGDIAEHALLAVRRAEVHFLEANQIRVLKIAAKNAEYDENDVVLEGKLKTMFENSNVISRNQLGFPNTDFHAVCEWLNTKSSRPSVHKRTLAAQLIDRYPLSHDMKHDEMALDQLICAKIDDAWISIENAERLLAGPTRKPQAWSRLCAIKLQILALFPNGEIGQEYRCLATRRPSEREEEARRILRLGYTVTLDDQFRRLRLADYFLQSMTPKRIHPLLCRGTLLEEKKRINLAEEALDDCGDKVFSDTINNENPTAACDENHMIYYYLAQYYNKLNIRINHLRKETEKM